MFSYPSNLDQVHLESRGLAGHGLPLALDRGLSGPRQHPKRQRTFRSGTAAPDSLNRPLIWVTLLLLALAVPCHAQSQADFAARAKERFHVAEAHYKKDTNNVEAAWQFARSCFDLAEFQTKSSERADIAQLGIAAAKLAVSRASNSAPAHYYLGMNIAQLARTKSLGALKLVGQMEREFLVTLDLDEKFDQAGADRNLGLLYRDAPSFGSIGSRPKARQHLEHAVKVAPDSPENRLNLIETYLKWGERPSAQRELKSLDELWPKARAIFSDKIWGSSWLDWEDRLKKLKEKLADSTR
jgi:tetratricopeptide (TPR) repeat protein